MEQTNQPRNETRIVGISVVEGSSLSIRSTTRQAIIPHHTALGKLPSPPVLKYDNTKPRELSILLPKAEPPKPSSSSDTPGCEHHPAVYFPPINWCGSGPLLQVNRNNWMCGKPQPQYRSQKKKKKGQFVSISISILITKDF